jgi:stress response protein YsnF
MIVPILEEVLVVEKRLMVKEEIHITKQRVEKHAPQRVTLRREEAVIERMQNPPQKEDMEGTEQEKT